MVGEGVKVKLLEILIVPFKSKDIVWMLDKASVVVTLNWLVFPEASFRLVYWSVQFERVGGVESPTVA